ncbi:oxidoreductase [Aphelenchoides avenae]|nr:oxidoreductase [Aphelenchus avenae]
MSNTVELSNGKKMPLLGLGTWQSTPGEVGRAVKVALKEGYRHIDTAFMYQNEAEIGNALQEVFAEGKLKREDVFITTKVFRTHMREGDLEKQLREQLESLKTDYVDLYLLHIPVAFKDLTTPDPTATVEDAWRAIEKVYYKGLTKAIGVSNFNVSQLERIQRIAKVPIHNIQVELHLHFAQFELHEFCKKHNTTLTAYAPIGSPGRAAGQTKGLARESELEPLKDPLVLKLAAKYGKTPAQILLRHLVERGIAVIPKSTNAQRIKENGQIFDFKLTQDEVQQLNKVPQGPRLFPMTPFTGHPEDPFADER